MSEQNFSLKDRTSGDSYTGTVTANGKARLVEFKFDRLNEPLIMSYEQARDHLLQDAASTTTIPLAEQKLTLNRVALGTIAMNAYLEAIGQSFIYRRQNVQGFMNNTAIELDLKGFLDIDRQTVLMSVLARESTDQPNFHFTEGRFSQSDGQHLLERGSDFTLTFTDRKHATISCDLLGNFILSFF
ncbi:hypothetical protein ACNAN0_00335 [Agrilactobacillus fermenti]|uniref:hypothetical protein n=1 Tax=Agrilactobacillus fermenti TaxID=2586909 RepID=UPI003A5BCB0C